MGRRQTGALPERHTNRKEREDRERDGWFPLGLRDHRVQEVTDPRKAEAGRRKGLKNEQTGRSREEDKKHPSRTHPHTPNTHYNYRVDVDVDHVDFSPGDAGQEGGLCRVGVGVGLKDRVT